MTRTTIRPLIRPTIRPPHALWPLAVLIASLAMPVAAQGDRERQQLMQLQQQLQKLRQENTQLQQGKTQEIEKLRSEAAQVKQEAVRIKAASTSGNQREAKRLGTELAQAKEALTQSQAELESLKTELAKREAALQAASQQLADDRRAAQTERGTLTARLKDNAQRAEVCEAKHAGALAVGQDVLKRYEDRQLRACEPFTGLWRVGEEARIQALRDRLFEARLDVLPAEPTAAGPK